MRKTTGRTLFAACSAVALTCGFAGDAFAQAAATQTEEIVVTGSRIRRSNLETPAPVQAVTAAEIERKGITNIADAINELPIAGMPQAPRGDQGDSATGRNYLNLFNLGTQRTLVLVNGRRYISSNPPSATGTPGNQVDLNTIPTGFIDRIEVVEAGGAAVYGTDAVAGVVNIILKKRFTGVDLDFQYGISDRDDYPTRRERGTIGFDFADGRGNFAVSAEHAWTGSLTAMSRDWSAAGLTTVSNPRNTSNTDGIPAQITVPDHRFIEFSVGGVPFRAPAPLPNFILTMPNPNGSGTVPALFGPGGQLIPYNIGTYYQPAFSSGGDGYRLADVTSLVTGVRRTNVSSIGSYDIADNVRLSGEFSYSSTRAKEPVNQGIFNTALLTGNNGPIRMTTANPFLSDQARTILNNQGASTFFLSRASMDLVPDGSAVSAGTEIYRGVLALDGDFRAFDRDFYWNVSANHAYGSGYFRSYGVNANRFNLAVDAVRAPNGQIVCNSTLQNPTSTNPDIAGCQPLNLFGAGSPSQAARDYVSALFERSYTNHQFNYLGSIGGDVVTLPGGKVKFVTGLEYRKDSAAFTPNANAANGIGRDIAIASVKGDYDTKEIYGETVVPILGGNFTLPFVQALEFSGSGRYVDHSIAGTDNAWSLGAKWKVTEDFSLRGTRSNTFRTPSLVELFLPASSSLTSGIDPCDARNINAGANPGQRTANCQALFRSLGLPSNFSLTSLGQNASVVNSINSGNPKLKNEHSTSWSAGFVAQPRWVPGLTFTADWVRFNVQDAIVTFDLATILRTCYDSPAGAASCSNFTRDSQAQLATARTGYVNAGFIKYYGQNFVLDYQVPLDKIFAGDPGRLGVTLSLNHTQSLATSVTGFSYDAVHGDNVVSGSGSGAQAPKWGGKIDVRYDWGPVGVNWTTRYVSSAVFDRTYTIENRDILGVDEYWQHDVAMHWEFRPGMTARFGVSNLADAKPPYPISYVTNALYYDVIGRSYFAGLNLKF
ncbi:TonB-dependent receptor domain-containing protein [Roseiterribacter gracilis]|uniref:TonB-dependent receptor n=1 Tax=Roseiterribacter gracilis TaxID=2812848 RepID=A0A8S8XGI2_9PROT|nr:TonB-dependent receptor [Rhodospirillales bacterium TMPK1]